MREPNFEWAGPPGKNAETNLDYELAFYEREMRQKILSMELAFMDYAALLRELGVRAEYWLDAQGRRDCLRYVGPFRYVKITPDDNLGSRWGANERKLAARIKEEKDKVTARALGKEF